MNYTVYTRDYKAILVHSHSHIWILTLFKRKTNIHIKNIGTWEIPMPEQVGSEAYKYLVKLLVEIAHVSEDEAIIICTKILSHRILVAEGINYKLCMYLVDTEWTQNLMKWHFLLFRRDSQTNTRPLLACQAEIFSSYQEVYDMYGWLLSAKLQPSEANFLFNWICIYAEQRQQLAGINVSLTRRN